ncbi:hypothetical protein D3C87_2140670 [compost metagenome]
MLICRSAALPGCITSTFGTSATSVIGAKSLTGSYGILLNSVGLMACVATAPMTMV